jgi:hypothetical protein
MLLETSDNKWAIEELCHLHSSPIIVRKSTEKRLDLRKTNTITEF